LSQQEKLYKLLRTDCDVYISLKLLIAENSAMCCHTGN